VQEATNQRFNLAGLPLMLLSFVPKRRAWKTATAGLVAYAAYACWCSVKGLGVLDTALCASLGMAGVALACLLISACASWTGRRSPATRLWLKWPAASFAAALCAAGAVLLFFALN